MNEKALMLCDCPLDRLFQSFLFFSWIELNWEKRINDNEIDCWLICLLHFLSFFLSLDWLIELNWMSNKQNKSSINLGGWLLIIGFIQLIVVMIDHFFDSYHFIHWLNSIWRWKKVRHWKQLVWYDLLVKSIQN